MSKSLHALKQLAFLSSSIVLLSTTSICAMDNDRNDLLSDIRKGVKLKKAPPKASRKEDTGPLSQLMGNPFIQAAATKTPPQDLSASTVFDWNEPSSSSSTSSSLNATGRALITPSQQPRPFISQLNPTNHIPSINLSVADENFFKARRARTLMDSIDDSLDYENNGADQNLSITLPQQQQTKPAAASSNLRSGSQNSSNAVGTAKPTPPVQQQIKPAAASSNPHSGSQNSSNAVGTAKPTPPVSAIVGFSMPLPTQKELDNMRHKLARNLPTIPSQTNLPAPSSQMRPKLSEVQAPTISTPPLSQKNASEKPVVKSTSFPAQSTSPFVPFLTPPISTPPLPQKNDSERPAVKSTSFPAQSTSPFVPFLTPPISTPPLPQKNDSERPAVKSTSFPAQSTSPFMPFLSAPATKHFPSPQTYSASSSSVLAPQWNAALSASFIPHVQPGSANSLGSIPSSKNPNEALQEMQLNAHLEQQNQQMIQQRQLEQQMMQQRQLEQQMMQQKQLEQQMMQQRQLEQQMMQQRQLEQQMMQQKQLEQQMMQQRQLEQQRQAWQLEEQQKKLATQASQPKPLEKVLKENIANWLQSNVGFLFKKHVLTEQDVRALGTWPFGEQKNEFLRMVLSKNKEEFIATFIAGKLQDKVKAKNLSDASFLKLGLTHFAYQEGLLESMKN